MEGGIPPAHDIEFCILIDLEATADASDDELTRLQQVEVHEIIEFVRPSVYRSALLCGPRSWQSKRVRPVLRSVTLSRNECLRQPAVWLAARHLDSATVAGSEIGHFREYVRPVESCDGGPVR